ncbi:THAP domain-containing protein 1 [Nilaparvata lugens]|uniref:THAP domain-containing protein 1 n=1 Tax=Nilaparvata lugens TaxID=108931 RepID=UPI00193C93C7|nr:THAP domain-containing protein 1 [Nilaparvata lugens]
MCAVRGCRKSRSTHPDLHFYRFPVNRPSICELWVKFCANESLDASVSKKTVNYRVVCEEHFEHDDFLNPLRLRLKPYAVPAIHSEAVKKETSSNIDPEIEVHKLLQPPIAGETQPLLTKDPLALD